MECCLKFTTSITLSSSSFPSSQQSIFRKSICYGRNKTRNHSSVVIKIEAVKNGDTNRRLSSVESHFCYDKAIPEEIIEKPVGLLSLGEKNIDSSKLKRCSGCEAKGVVLCATCAGSGLYVDSIMESQGIIVKVRCLGCGGSGNIMCSQCGGRGGLAAF